MAQFVNLHDVGTALADVLRDAIGAGLDVLPGPPLQNPASASEAVRLTLLWVTPQPMHRNDPWERRFDGRLEPPPLSLSGFFMVSAYGTTPQQDPEQAYNLLGEVLRVFDAAPRIELPNAATTLGEGAIGVVLVPTAADLMEKVYSPLQVPHRPWALLEAGPIQLVSRRELGPEQALVHPGGARLGEFVAGARPDILAITPSPAGQGGRIRIDARYTGTVELVRIGPGEVSVAGLVVPQPGGPVILDLPAAVTPGAHDVSLRVGGVWSSPVSLEVRPADVASADAPATLQHSIVAPLVLQGRVLDTTTLVFLWPDGGVRSPADVASVAPSAVTSGQVTVAAADLAGLAGREMRLALRTSPHGFTPFVRMGFAP